MDQGSSGKGPCPAGELSSPLRCARPGSRSGSSGACAEECPQTWGRLSFRSGYASNIVGAEPPRCHPSSGYSPSLPNVGLHELQRGFAEFVGTFALVFIGVGAIAATGGHDLTAAALAHGLVIAVMASAVGHISGGHFNPAVTLGFLVTRRIVPRLAATYWFAQITAAILAALLLRGLLPERSTDPVNLGAPSLSGVSAGQGLVIESLLTFFLVWVIFATAADPRGAFRQIAGLAIGLTITLDIFMGGQFTGAMMNPARALGPQLVQNVWSDAWVWYLGPALGACAAALSYEWLYLGRIEQTPVGTGSGVEEPAASGSTQ